ncbi:sensor domain-containing diguanylate cyclase [Vibrio salinus]|uniref:sensor domain-containing diguanylate cyclase n=1 Tax=Vibrio salinus TaxID=2899784 RepID=UPI001E6314B0|nr:GGDEF domain-containing protein [Vibrio salinus]MCE0494600.1 GGDEF domain-containing protein [Vibrio salinus]
MNKSDHLENRQTSENEELLSRYFKILDTLPDHIFIFSESGIYVDVFGGEDNATGFDCKPFIGKKLHDVTPKEMSDMFLFYIRTSLSTNQTQKVKYKFDEQDMIDLPADVPKPQEIWFEGTIKPLPLIHDGEKTVLWIAKNITQQHVLEQQLKSLSEIDELTSIFNRRSLTNTLKSAIDEYHQFGRVFSLIMFDIDKFKRVNDTLGHAAGDEVIKHVVNVCLQELRSCDTIGRFGGEEFAIILRDTHIDNAFFVAEKLRIQLEESVCELRKYNVNVTASLGVTEVLADDFHVRSIISRADKAMYHSKMKGRNCTSSFNTEVETRNSEFSNCSWLTVKAG